jgi:hypothetical protein
MLREGSPNKAFEQKVLYPHLNQQSVGSNNHSYRFPVELVSELKFVTLPRIRRYINRINPASGHAQVKPSRYAFHA